MAFLLLVRSEPILQEASMAKRVLITGITGQDGAYLAQLLIDKGYEVYGGYRRNSNLNLWRLRELGIEEHVTLIPFDLLEFTNVFRTIETIRPDEVYNLAAQSFVAASFEQPILTAEINALGPLRILEALRTLKPDAKFYQASTSEMFGSAQIIPQNENTAFHPRSAYAFSKLMAHWATVNYREAFAMFTCSGILFNHESPLRGLEFVTRKITWGVSQIKYGLRDKITLGNVEAKRDWGFAPEYVEAMWLMMQQESPDDYVIATGETHSVREFVETAFKVIGVDLVWDGAPLPKAYNKRTGQVLVETSEALYRPSDVPLLVGDFTKAKRTLGWTPKIKFERLVELMVEADLKRIFNLVDKKSFVLGSIPAVSTKERLIQSIAL